MLVDIQRISDIYNQFIQKALVQRTPILILASPDVDALASARILTVYSFHSPITIHSLFFVRMESCIPSNKFQDTLIFNESIKHVYRIRKMYSLLYSHT